MGTIICLSYIIHNFNTTWISVRINLKIRAGFLARNVFTLYHLLNLSSRGFRLTNDQPIVNSILHTIGNEVFKKLAKVALKRPKFLKYTPVGTNFPKAAQYAALSQLTLMLEKKKVTPQLLPLSSHSWLYPYYHRTSIVITPTANRPHALMLLKLFNMVLAMWSYWPKKYRITAHYSVIRSQWRLLTFLNSYYFKVYNI